MGLKQKVILVQSVLGVVILGVGYWFFEARTNGQNKEVLYVSLFLGFGMIFSAFLKLMSKENES